MSNAEAVAVTPCLAPDEGLAPIDKNGLQKLIEAGKANPQAIKTLKCKTVAEGRFRHLNYIRELPPYIVDEPPGLLGDDTAPNPSEASLAALGSCLAVGLHAERLELLVRVEVEVAAAREQQQREERPASELAHRRMLRPAAGDRERRVPGG